jgi:hypothetical protein
LVLFFSIGTVLLNWYCSSLFVLSFSIGTVLLNWYCSSQLVLFFSIAAVHGLRYLAIVCKVGQNRIYAQYMTVYFVISLPKIPFMHRIYIWFWPSLIVCIGHPVLHLLLVQGLRNLAIVCIDYPVLHLFLSYRH